MEAAHRLPHRRRWLGGDDGVLLALLDCNPGIIGHDESLLAPTFWLLGVGPNMRLMLCILGLALASLAVPTARAQDADDPEEPPRTAVIIQLHEDINPLSGALLKRRFEQAVERGVDIVVLDIDSPGGYLSTTLELVRMIEDATQVETVAYVEREAISGAAILALATDRIVMLPRARIGDAGMIIMGEDSAFRYAPEKARSLLAQQLRDLAEKHGRPTALVEAMIDKDLIVTRATRTEDGEVRYLSNRDWDALDNREQWEKGPVVREAPGNTFFTANGARAVELGVAEQVIDDREQLAVAIGAIGPIPVIQPSSVDTLILILNSPVVTWLLLVIGLIALVIELGAPGMGVGGMVSILCFGLFFWSRFLGGTSGWFEVILFVIGLVFLMLEIFIIPGIGVAGITGGLMVLFSLVMASRRFMMPESARDLSELMTDIGVVLAAFVGFAIGLGVLARYLGELPMISRMALAPVQLDDDGAVGSLAAGNANGEPAWQRVQIGDVGQTLGPLRPSGKMLLHDDVVDVVSEGDFVAADTQVRVVAAQGRRIVVRSVG